MAPDFPTPSESIPVGEPSVEGLRSRLRFADFEKKVFPNGRTSVRVSLEWLHGQHFEAEVDGSQTREAETRTAAEAVLRSGEEATEGRLALTLLGAKAIRVFDSWVVIVSARGKSEENTYRLIGAYACPDDRTTRGAALAALNATNRILAKYMPG